MDRSIAALLKSPAWLLLVLLGVLTFLWAALPPDAVIAGAHVGLDGSSRHGVAVLGIVLIVFGILFGLISVLISVGLIGRRTGQSGADNLPIQKITINSQQTTLQPYPRVRLSGEVTPKKAGVNVWLLREDLAQRSGMYFPSAGFTTTNGNGQWEQSVALWKPGPFRVQAVVTTEEYDKFYRLYRIAYDAALNNCQQQNPEAYWVPGWPYFDALPKASVAADSLVTLYS